MEKYWLEVHHLSLIQCFWLLLVSNPKIMKIFGLATSYPFPFRIVQVQLHKPSLNVPV